MSKPFGNKFTPQRSEKISDVPEVICLDCGTGIFVEHGDAIWQNCPGTWLSDSSGYVHADKELCTQRRTVNEG